MPLTAADRAELLRLADVAIRRGLWPDTTSAPGPPTSAALEECCGVFVTVTVDGNLNGCIGSLRADEPLVAAVPRLARQAAFADPRLPRLTVADYERMQIKVAILSPLSPIGATTEAELLAALRPGIDGLVLAAGGRQATFLPAVWQTLPGGAEFLDHLKVKAGIRQSTWPEGIQAWRYRTTEFASDAPGGPAGAVS